MRLVVTGGGTGGHVYPALEVANLAIDAGHEVQYLGSLRGIEANACKEARIAFTGFRSVPMPRICSFGGLRAALQILRSSSQARRKLSALKPDVVFSTGGYAAGPILAAARTLKVPVVLHEQNSVPGRTNRIMAPIAKKICVVFEGAAEFFPGKAVRTGMPVRKNLLEASARQRPAEPFFTLCYGGSQGSAALNEAVITMAMRQGGPGREFLQITGPKLFESAAKSVERLCKPEGLSLKPYLDESEMADAYARSSLAVSRSGSGTICELALFGIPAVFVPYPFAHANHQYHNAKAIEKIGGATIVEQSELTPERLESEWKAWKHSPDLREEASASLKSWAVRDAAEQVLRVVTEVKNASSV